MTKLQPKDGVLLPGDAVAPLDAVTKKQLDALSLTGGGHAIQDEGTSLTTRARLNFRGAGVAASDDSVAGTTQVDIPGGISQADADTRYVNETDHTKLAHDALFIDAATLDGVDSTGFAAASHVGSRDGHPVATTTLDGLMVGVDKAKLDGLGATAWQDAPALLNGWVAFAVENYPRVSRVGEIVFIEGVVKKASPVLYETIFVLPAGFRPGQIVSAPNTSSNSSTPGTGFVQAVPDGVLRYAGGASGTLFYTSISFRRA